jgi:hypothetical protein
VIVLNWSIANAGNDDGPCYGSVGWNIRRDGWAGFIAKHVEPAIAWCEASGIKPDILIHHAFGQYGSEDMHLDAWDYANGVAPWLTNGFATKDGWLSVTKRVDVFGYVGGVDITPRLRNLPAAELIATIRRNLKPYKSAGFKGVFVDFAENAIPHPFTNPTIPSQTTRRSLDTLVLEIADDMFPMPAGVESSPRRFPEFSHLWKRLCVMTDEQYQHRYGANRHTEWKALGYDRSVLSPPFLRTLPYSDDTSATVAAAKAIAADGDVACICPAPLIRAGITAKELLN